MAAASAFAAPRKARPFPATTNSMGPSSGNPNDRGSSESPAGTKPSDKTHIPIPAKAAALRPLRLPDVHTMRQLLPARSSA